MNCNTFKKLILTFFPRLLADHIQQSSLLTRKKKSLHLSCFGLHLLWMAWSVETHAMTWKIRSCHFFPASPAQHSRADASIAWWWCKASFALLSPPPQRREEQIPRQRQHSGVSACTGSQERMLCCP